jgi:hypothetical protein
MGQRNVVYVRALSQESFELRRFGSASEVSRLERQGLSAAEMAAVIRRLPASCEIRFFNEAPGPVSLVAPVSAALERYNVAHDAGAGLDSEPVRPRRELTRSGELRVAASPG